MVVALDVTLLAQPGPMAMAEALGEAAVSEAAVGRRIRGPLEQNLPTLKHPWRWWGGSCRGKEGQRGVSVPPFLFCCFPLRAPRGGCGCHPLLRLGAWGWWLLR